MEIETTVNETIPNSEGETELETEMESPEKVNAETTESAEAEEVKPAETTEEKPRVPKIPIEAPKNNGVTTPVKPKQLAGIVVQYPEMFSLKRDAHFLEKFEDASDIKVQRMAYIECENEEAAAALQKKLNGASLNNKKVTASRLDLTEKKVLYVNSIKRETTDDMVKEAVEGIVQMKREAYNTFMLFGSEAEARAAKTKMNKEGVCGTRVHCEFDHRAKDRFKTEEPAAKKQKVEEVKSEEKPAEAAVEEEETAEAAEGEVEAAEEAKEEEAKEEEEEAMEEGGEEAAEAEEEQWRITWLR